MSDDGNPVFRFIFFMLFGLVFSYTTIETLSEQRFGYGYRGSETRTILTPTESPVGFWCVVAGQVTIAVTSFAIALMPLTPGGKARRDAWNARDKMLKKAQQKRKDAKRKKKNRRKGK